MRNNTVNYRPYGTINLAEVKEFKSLSEIENLLKKLDERLKATGYVTLADYYELVGATVLDDDSMYGWTNLINTDIRMGRYGYTLSMPRAESMIVDSSQKIKTAIDILDNADIDSIEDAANEAREILNSMLG